MLESTWREPTPDCPEPELWAAPDGMSCEYEVADFLRALVRLTKPKVVLETGCFDGHASRAIGEALRANGRGKLWTCDIDPVRVEQTIKVTDGLPVNVALACGLDLCLRTTSVDLAFIDSGGAGDRIQEMNFLNLSPNALIVVHDARGFPHPRTPALLFPTPRGLAIYAHSAR